MHRTYTGIVLASALVGVLAAVFVHELSEGRAPAEPPKTFVSADGQSTVEWSDPVAAPVEPAHAPAVEPIPHLHSSPVLLQPVPMPEATNSAVEMTTVAHRAAPEPVASEPPARPSTNTGYLRRAGFAVDGAQVYLLESDGKAMLYAIGSADIALDPLVNQFVQLAGFVRYRDDLRMNCIHVCEALALTNKPESTEPQGTIASGTELANSEPPVAAPEAAPPSPELMPMPTPVEPEMAPMPTPVAEEGHYLDERPQYFPPTPQFPLSRELATMEPQAVPAPTSDVPQPVFVPQPVPPVEPIPVAPAQTYQAPPMPPAAPCAKRTPLPLPELEALAPKRRAAKVEIVPVSGSYPCTLEKGALMIPRAAGEQMDKAPPRVLFVALAPDQKCLWIYSSTGIDRLAEQLDRTANSEDKARCNRRMCFSRLQRVAANADGSFPLPVDLMEVGCMKDNVILIGVRDHFELWDAEQWQKYTGQGAEGKP
ncbi:MAG: hypothetical protein K2R98_06460 [Gemmataceae bacterium]|nr:hypothetical protein [Gemmataceae bacterium]